MACEAGRILTASRLFLSLPQQSWSSRRNDHHALLPDLVVFCFCSHTQHRHTGTVCGLAVVSQNREEALFKAFPVWECGRQSQWPPSRPPLHQRCVCRGPPLIDPQGEGRRWLFKGKPQARAAPHPLINPSCSIYYYCFSAP